MHALITLYNLFQGGIDEAEAVGGLRQRLHRQRLRPQIRRLLHQGQTKPRADHFSQFGQSGQSGQHLLQRGLLGQHLPPREGADEHCRQKEAIRSKIGQKPNFCRRTQLAFAVRLHLFAVLISRFRALFVFKTKHLRGRQQSQQQREVD